MRITNKVMQNNALTNINRNKELQDNLNTQLATGKKIEKPSDDPVTAIRALRLRSDVSQTTQFYKKNVPDANSWLELTESSTKTVIGTIKDMIVQCEKGSNDTLTTSDRQTIVNSLKQLRDEVYSTGNADYAGRYIFTGYRTETPLTFTENTTKRMDINEVFTHNTIESSQYVSTKTASGNDLLDITESSYDGTNQLSEQDITTYNFHRVRLAYDNNDPSGTVGYGFTDDKLNPVGITCDFERVNDKEEAYKKISEEAGNKMIYVPSTGEVLISDSLYEEMKQKNAQLNYGYEKSNWNKGDLMPQHYFVCTEIDGSVTPAKTIDYNKEDSNGDGVYDAWEKGLADQEIEYQVGFSQFIRVNTTAGDVYQHGTGRDVDELIDLANQLDAVEAMQKKLQSMRENSSYTDTQKESINKDLEAANKAVTLLKDQLHNKFSSTITSMQSYLDTANEALTTIGNRSSRLELIENRLANQQTTFKTLQSENEDADATEVAVQLSSAQVSYEAGLMATADMIKTTLLNYL